MRHPVDTSVKDSVYMVVNVTLCTTRAKHKKGAKRQPKIVKQTDIKVEIETIEMKNEESAAEAAAMSEEPKEEAEAEAEATKKSKEEEAPAKNSNEKHTPR